MADKVIQVNVTSTKSQRVSVTPGNVQNEINATPDSSQYYSNLAKSWAIAENIVDGKDYSSKHYAKEAQQASALANTYKEATEQAYISFSEQYANAETEITTLKDAGVQEINTAVTDGKTEITTAKDLAIDAVNNTKTTILQDIEFVTDGEKQEIEDLIDNGKDEIQELTNEIKENAEDIINRVGISMFDTVLKDHVLTYEESKGLALQGTYVYKDAIAGSRYGYPTFYEKCVEEFQDASNTYEVLQNNYEVVGSPTITEYGVASGFSASDYLTVNNVTLSDNNWNFILKFSTQDISTNQGLLSFSSGYTVGAVVNPDGGRFWVSLGQGTSFNIGEFGFKIEANKEYTIKIGYDGEKYFISELVGDEFIVRKSFISSLKVPSNLGIVRLGLHRNGNAFLNGSIDLKQFSITVDGKEVYRAVDYIATNPNGHKFYPIHIKSLIDERYTSTGTAWFYGVDTENERIFLPRNDYATSYIANGDKTASVYGNGKALGISSISKTGLNSQSLSVFPDANYLTLGAGSLNSYRGSTLGVTKTASASGLTGTVNLQNTQNGMYLYICVGNTTSYEGMTEVVNQGMEILEQVNQGIESRVKLDGSNAEFPYVVETYKNGQSWYRVYSDGWCEQGGDVTVSKGTSGYAVALLKPVVHYNVLLTMRNSAYGTSGWGVSSKTTTQFSIFCSIDTSRACAWRADGWLYEGE